MTMLWSKMDITIHNPNERIINHSVNFYIKIIKLFRIK